MEAKELQLIPGIEISLKINRDKLANFLVSQVISSLHQLLAPPVASPEATNTLVEAEDKPEPTELELARNDFAPKNCIRCGTIFVPTNNNHIYCNRECAKNSWLEKRKAKTETRKEDAVESSSPEEKPASMNMKRQITVTCAFPKCGKEFAPKHMLQKFCGKKCSQNLWTSKNSERLKENGRLRAKIYAAKKRANKLQTIPENSDSSSEEGERLTN